MYFCCTQFCGIANKLQVLDPTKRSGCCFSYSYKRYNIWTQCTTLFTLDRVHSRTVNKFRRSGCSRVFQRRTLDSLHILSSSMKCSRDDRSLCLELNEFQSHASNGAFRRRKKILVFLPLWSNLAKQKCKRAFFRRLAVARWIGYRTFERSKRVPCLQDERNKIFVETKPSSLNVMRSMSAVLSQLSWTNERKIK